MLPLVFAAAASLGSAAINANAQSQANKQAQAGAANAANRAGAAWNELSGAYDANEQLLRDYESKIGKVYSPEILNEATKNYKVLLSDPNSLYYEPTDFDYGKSVEDFYDKAWETSANAQQRALERSAANAGGLYSSGLINNTATLMGENATKAYKEAREAYMQDKGLALQQWQAYNDMLKNKASSRLGLMQAYGGAMNSGLGYYGDVTSARISNQNSAADAYANLAGTYSNLVSQAGNNSVNPWASFKAPTQQASVNKLY